MQPPKPSFFRVFNCKCPRCRRGDMFLHPHPYQKGFMKMPDTCSVCGQYFDLEPGFYYGSSYVSYGLTVAFSVATFVAWAVLIGISSQDNRIFYWLITNGVLLLVLQPYFMRLSRALWLWMFVKYDRNWQTTPAPKPERINESQKNAW
ncbi:MAG: DUF983 domain-containing protein [Chitinophagaceae bacterium]|nr:MAG: DUF983 domain-containing protein [Chitinophagaceae bacterium]